MTAAIMLAYLEVVVTLGMAATSVAAGYQAWKVVRGADRLGGREDWAFGGLMVFVAVTFALCVVLLLGHWVGAWS